MGLHQIQKLLYSKGANGKETARTTEKPWPALHLTRDGYLKELKKKK